MADEIPPAPSESDDASKAETIRITLPPKQEQQAVKRETVRINLPGKPLPPPGTAPKKETTKLTGVAPAAPTPPPPVGAKPFVPPAPPKPPGAPGVPPPPAAPGVPPKPPTVGARPTVPLKPAPPAGAAPSAPAAPVGAPKPAAPKKETARISLPAEGAAKPALPKATVKMQQTQPLVNKPAPALTPAAPITAASMAPAHAVHAGNADADGTVNLMSIAALVVSLISLALVFFAYSAASL